MPATFILPTCVWVVVSHERLILHAMARRDGFGWTRPLDMSGNAEHTEVASTTVDRLSSPAKQLRRKESLLEKYPRASYLNRKLVTQAKGR